MTDVQHIDVDSDEFLDAPKALRDHVKKLQQVNTRLAEQVTDLSGKATESALSGVLTGFKNPERVKRDLLADKIDPLDSKAVETWLAANGDDYARGDGAPNPDPNSSSVDQAEVDAQQRINSGGDLRNPADMSKLEAAMAEMTDNMTGAQVAAIYKKHGL